MRHLEVSSEDERIGSLFVTYGELSRPQLTASKGSTASLLGQLSCFTARICFPLFGYKGTGKAFGRGVTALDMRAQKA